jgi:hypothetical protein
MEGPSSSRRVYSAAMLRAIGEDLAAERYEIGFFSGALRTPCWSDSAGRLVSPAEVLDYPDVYPEHWARIQAADPSRPILVSADQGTVIDGMYRLCRLWLSGASTVRARHARDTHSADAARSRQKRA